MIQFPITACPSCHHQQAETTMTVTNIPHFKEIIIMTLYCQNCGFRSNEVKSSGRISKVATKITLIVESENDLKREVIKSDSAGIEIPQLQLTLMEGGMCGVYTTVEGLLQNMYDGLSQVQSPSSFASGGDLQNVVEKLQRMKDGDASVLPFTLLINDPLSNSFIGPAVSQPKKNVHDLAKQSSPMVEGNNADGNSENECNIACCDDEREQYEDTNLIVEEYERTFEQNEELGLNDMKT